MPRTCRLLFRPCHRAEAASAEAARVRRPRELVTAGHVKSRAGRPANAMGATAAGATTLLQDPRNERIDTIHPAADCDVPACCRCYARRVARLFLAAGILAAAGGLSDYPGDNTVARCKSGHDGCAGDGAARA